MYFMYILWSEGKARFYVGHTDDLAKRLDYHNRGNVKSTRAGAPWRVAYSEPFDSRSAAMRREVQIKGWKSQRSIRELIDRSPE
jgi:putative endonuclease